MTLQEALWFADIREGMISLACREQLSHEHCVQINEVLSFGGGNRVIVEYLGMSILVQYVKKSL